MCSHIRVFYLGVILYKEKSYIFPKTFDDANVFYTPKDNFGCIYFDNGDIADYVYFFAICNYQNDDVYYLFTCNENYEVVGDSI